MKKVKENTKQTKITKQTKNFFTFRLFRYFRLFRIFSWIFIRGVSINQSRKTAITVSLTFVALLLLFPQTGSTHEPITTKVMFNKEVIRILQKNCLGCHSPGKIKADIPLTTYEEARPWAKAIKEEVLEKRMMPYQAVKGYGSFQHDYILPQRDVELLVSWIEGGAPRGEEKDYPKQSIELLIKGDKWPLAQPDLVLQPVIEAQIPVEGDDEIRCFALNPGLTEDRWIRAVDFQPGNGSTVYSASYFITQNQKRIKTDKYGCAVAGSEASFETLGHWVPGQLANPLPDGTAMLLPPDSRIWLKVRYHNNGASTIDPTNRLGLYFAKASNNKTVHNVIVKLTEAKVTSNTDRQRIKVTYPVTESTEAVSIRPRLFPSLKSIEAVAYRPDGTIEVLIWAKNYRFDWQPAYYFKKPVSLPKGTRIEITAYPNDSENGSDLNSPVLCEIGLAKKF